MAFHPVSRDPRSWLLAGTVAAVVIAGIIFRLSNIATHPLWLDEAYSAYAASKGFDFLWRVVPLYETHPPFYYSLVRLWMLGFGEGLASLRGLGFVCGLATLGVVAWLAVETARLLGLRARAMALLIAAAVMMVALSPMAVEMTRQVRPYPVMILVYAIGIAALMRLACRMSAGGGLGGGSYCTYLAALALMLWLHNLGVLYAAAMGGALLVLCARPGWTRQDWIAFAGGHLLVLAVWMPAVAILIDQAPTWIHSTWLTFPPNALGNRILTLLVVPNLVGTIVGLSVVLWAIVHFSPNMLARRAGIALLVLALGPLVVSLAVSATITPIFIVRTMTPIFIPILLLVAAGIVATAERNRWLGAGALLIILAQMGAVDMQSRRAGPPEDWYAVVRWMQDRMGDGDIVLTYPNEGSLPFDRAVGDLKAGIASHPVPRAVPAIGVGGWYPTGSRGVVSLPPVRLRVIAGSARVAAAPTVWLIRMGPWAYDRGDVFLREIARGRDHAHHLQSGVIFVDGWRRPDGPQSVR